MQKGYRYQDDKCSFYIGVGSTHFGLGFIIDSKPATCYDVVVRFQINIFWLETWLVIYK